MSNPYWCAQPIPSIRTELAGVGAPQAVEQKVWTWLMPNSTCYSFRLAWLMHQRTLNHMLDRTIILLICKRSSEMHEQYEDRDAEMLGDNCPRLRLRARSPGHTPRLALS